LPPGSEATTALLRGVANSFAGALVRDGHPSLDPERARDQHRAYRRELERAGYAVTELAADEACPDCVFVEDTAVIVGDVAVITRPGAPSRRPECDPVAAHLAVRFPLVTIADPGLLDGGDVLITNGMVFVGVSERTNEAGIGQLAEVAARQDLAVVAVPVLDTLHLKSAVLALDPETVLVTSGGVEEAALSGLHILYEDAAERYRASALPLRDGRLLVTASAPRTAAMLSGAGYDVATVDISELEAADGGLTCLSILY
jgi:dimethylargininase